MRSLRGVNDSAEPAHNSKPLASTKGEQLMKQFLAFRDALFSSDATDEQKKLIWSEFLKLYTGVI